MTAYDFIALNTKPSAQICHKFYPAIGTTKPVLVVFLNPLSLSQTTWEETIKKLRAQPPPAGLPALLTYDRYGQGKTTDSDPADADAVDPSHAHDSLDVVRDLRQLVRQIAVEKFGILDVNDLSLVLVGNSIGCALSRLYAQQYPNSVAGLLLLDSILANTDSVSILPDPEASDFDECMLPVGVNLKEIRTAREVAQSLIHPSNGSEEGLSRKNLMGLLPHSDRPLLRGPDGQGPWVTVVGHEWQAFENEQKEHGVSELITRVFSSPFWHDYNEGLAKITDATRSKGPFQAPGAGHFIQRDNPDFVEKELRELLNKVLS